MLMGVEGGHMIGNDLANLRRFFDLGVRYMTLTHSVNTDWADSSTDPPHNAGLNDFGRDVVREMNRLGMMVDISHVADATFDDVLALTRAPVFASHSSVRAICRVPRNMNDRMLRDLGAHGGVMQVNYHMGFLSQRYSDAIKANDGRIGKAIDALAAERCGTDDGCLIATGAALARERQPPAPCRASSGRRSSTTSTTRCASPAPRTLGSARISTAPTCPSAWRTSPGCRSSPPSCCAAATPGRRCAASSARTCCGVMDKVEAAAERR